MSQGMDNYSHRQYGEIAIGDITTFYHPRKYAVRCLKCQSSWTALHTDITTYLTSGGGGIPCQNSACRLGFIKVNDRQEYILDKRDEYQRERAAWLERMTAKYGYQIVAGQGV